MFAGRRAWLMAALGTGAAIFAAAHETRRNGDVDFEFRQDSTFYYLTGFEEPDAIAVLRPGHDEPFVLFVRPHDPDMAIWVGPRAGIEGAVERFGADVAFPVAEFEERLPELLADTETLHVALGADSTVDRAVAAIVERRRDGAQRGPAPIAGIVDPTPAVDRLRLIKGDEEVAALQQAVDVTGAGLQAAWAILRPGMREYEVQAVLEAEYRRRGSPRNGFPSIVASGPMSCTLHYTSNGRVIEDGDLLLLDTGAECDYYSADVTRMVPANGRFSAEQRAVYDIVLEAQQRGIEAVAPGVPFHDVHQAALRVLVQGLIDLEVLTGEVDEAIEQQTYRPYYMHSTSHWLGLDVHDVGPYRTGETSTPLEPGMVLTVEPGLYLAPETPGVPEALRGIGIRIEDDVLVTPDGYRNLSAHIPSAPGELERLVGGA